MKRAWIFVAALSAIAAIGGSYFGAYHLGEKAGYTRRNEEVVSLERDQLIKSAGMMVKAYNETNKLLLELHDDSPDDKDLTPAGIASTLGGMRHRQQTRGRTYTSPSD